jgi:transposase
LPTQRGNVSQRNLKVIKAILLLAENGCKWRASPKRLGNWHPIYTRMNRWAKAGVLDRLFAELQREQLIRIKIEAVTLDNTIVNVHPEGTGALKKMAHEPSASPAAAGAPKFIWLPRVLDAKSPRSRPCDEALPCELKLSA